MEFGILTVQGVGGGFAVVIPLPVHQPEPDGLLPNDSVGIIPVTDGHILVAAGGIGIGNMRKPGKGHKQGITPGGTAAAAGVGSFTVAGDPLVAQRLTLFLAAAAGLGGHTGGVTPDMGVGGLWGKCRGRFGWFGQHPDGHTDAHHQHCREDSAQHRGEDGFSFVT